MKNKSFKYPFPTLNDKIFDADKDGKLNITETMLRDMHLDEMSRNDVENCNEQNKQSQPNKSFSIANILVGVIVGVVAIITVVPAVILGVCFLLLSSSNGKK